MKFPSPARCLLAGVVLISLVAFRAPAQSAPASTPSTSVADIIKMLDAKVSSDVIKTYVETSANVVAPTADDLITLKNHGATDDVTVALLKRTSSATPASGAPAAAPAGNQNSSDQTAAVLAAYLAANRSATRFDPESYDYFRYYYLYPRTLANVNATLGYNAAYYGFGGNPRFPIIYGAHTRPDPFGTFSVH